MGLLIEEVFESVFDARKDAFRTSNKRDEIFHVYMTVEFFRDCMNEIRGAVSASVMEFYQDRKVMGCPVFLVVESFGGERHTPWRVVKVSGLTSGESSEEIARLRAELEAARGDAERLQAEMTNIICSIPEGYYMDPPDGGDVTVAEQVRRMAVDAEQLKNAITKHNDEMDAMCADKSRCGYAPYKRKCPECPTDYKIDAAIDAARGKDNAN